MKAQSLKVSKITAAGFGRKINSEYGYSSFEFTPTILEAEVNPALDISTEEGMTEFKKIKKDLQQIAVAMLEADIEYFAGRHPELKISLDKKDRIIQKLLEAEVE